MKAARPHRVVAWVMPPIGHLAAAAFYFRFSVFCAYFALLLLCLLQIPLLPLFIPWLAGKKFVAKMAAKWLWPQSAPARRGNYA